MKNKILKLLILFVVLFSLKSFSQTTEKSKHPLLDKYYPQKQNTDTGTKVNTQIKPVTPPETGPPAITAVKKVTNNTLPVTENKLEKPMPGSTVNKPVDPAIIAPSQEKVSTKPSTGRYINTRLGSSSPLYNTYEKNSNGAGSVTTKPKG